MKKACIVILAITLIASIAILAGCNRVVYDFSVANNDFSMVEQSATNQKVVAERISTTGSIVTEPKDNYDYGDVVVSLQEEDSVTLTVTLEQADKLALYADWFILHNGLIDSEVEIEINDEIVSERSSFKALWHNQTETFSVDSFGNEIVPTQEKLNQWITDAPLYEYDALTAIAPVYQFNAGRNTVKMTVITAGQFLLGQVVVKAEKIPDNYQTYKQNVANSAAGTGSFVAEAEHLYYKTSTSIVPTYSADVNVTPYETYSSPLNTISGLNSPTQTVCFEINVPSNGIYNIDFNYSNSNANRVTFAKVEIDGAAPFSELLRYPFLNGDGYSVETLTDRESGQPFGIYLTAGKHLLSVKIDGSMVAKYLDDLTTTIDDLNSIYLDLKKIAGTIQDTNREWNPDTDYPGVVKRFQEINKQLYDLSDVLRSINGSDSVNYQAIIYFEAAINAIEGLLEKPRYIANNYAQLSEGSGSIVQTLANARSDIESTTLDLDKVVVYAEGGDNGIEHRNGFFAFWEGTKKFFRSFVTDYSVVSDDDDTIEVWVARSRQYVDLMQQLIDASDFTARTGYKVRFSILADEGKLILSNAANISPNAVMGISNWLPYEMGIRDLTVDLTKYSDYGEVISRFSSGAMISLIADGKGLALPETQDFYVMYYRKDILAKWGITQLPDTWDDVISMLPEIQRHGANFYIPLSSSTSSKSIMTTAPFIYQHGGNLFSDDATHTTISEENSLNAVKLMTELYTLYGLPQQISNFFDNFRNGSLPIGISTFDTYIRLSMAAPEISGKWGVALSPGVRNSDGVVERWQTGSATSMTLLKSGDDKKDDAGWELLKWWSSADIQTEFMNRLTMLYGKAYIWNSANLEAFNNSVAFATQDKKVILEQWQWMREIPKVPGWYMLERELSNAWNNIVINGQNTRSVIENAVTTVDKELQRKLEEFGYIENGKVVKPYKLTTLEDIEAIKRGE